MQWHCCPGMQPPQPSCATHMDRRTCARCACPLAPLAAEGAKQAAKIGAAVVGAGLGAFITKQLAAKRQSAAIIELSNLLVGSLVLRVLPATGHRKLALCLLGNKQGKHSSPTGCPCALRLCEYRCLWATPPS